MVGFNEQSINVKYNIEIGPKFDHDNQLNNNREKNNNNVRRSKYGNRIEFWQFLFSCHHSPFQYFVPLTHAWLAQFTHSFGLEMFSVQHSEPVKIYKKNKKFTEILSIFQPLQLVSCVSHLKWMSLNLILIRHQPSPLWIA